MHLPEASGSERRFIDNLTTRQICPKSVVVKTMSVGEFKSRFSEALDAVRKGESITVTFGRKKKAVAIVSPVPTKGTNRPLGLLAGKARIAIADDWEINESQFLGT